MNRYARLLKTSIGCKAVMAVTGLLLLLFVIAHLLGNLQIYKGQDAVNDYAAMMQGLGPLLWAMRLGLLAVFVVHIGAAFRLHQINRQARPVEYEFRAVAQQDPVEKARLNAAIYMLQTGLVVLAFLLFHLAHFTLGWINPGAYRSPDTQAEPVDAAALGIETNHAIFMDESGRLVDAADRGRYLDSKGRHDVYRMFIEGFRVPYIAVLYVFAMLVLGGHLFHGSTSMFQTAGINHPAVNRGIRVGGRAVVALIVLGNCLMPLTVWLSRFPGLPGEGS